MAGRRGELVEVDSPRKARNGVPGRTAVYRHVSAKEAYADREGIDNLFDSFATMAEKYPYRKCLGWRASDTQGYTWLTYRETLRWAEKVAAGLDDVGLKAGDRVGVFGANCKELMVVMKDITEYEDTAFLPFLWGRCSSGISPVAVRWASQACNRQNYVCVPLYDSLGAQAVEYIIQHAQISVVISASDRLKPLAAAIKQSNDLVKQVIFWGPKEEDSQKEIESTGAICRSFEHLMLFGGMHAAAPGKAGRDDLCTIMYTSGTTGIPKGVKITHGAVLVCVAGQLQRLEESAKKYDQSFDGDDEVMLSFLPLAHIYDRAVEEAFLANGSAIGYWRGSIQGLQSDIAALRPTMFIGVPRVYDRIRQGALETVSKRGPISAAIFRWAFKRKLYYMNQGFVHDKASPFTDWLVWRKVAARLGGRIKLIATGSAPLAPATRDFVRVGLCAAFIEGYGLTETMGSSFTCEPIPSAMGSVGVPSPVLEYALESIPDMNYSAHSDPPQGEILIRGPVLFSGYYLDEERTAEIIDDEGFFHTGDVGQIDDLGQLHIIDRKKSLFKLSQGEYISPEYIESMLQPASAVEMIWVTGQSDQSAAVAVIVPCVTAPEVAKACNGDLRAFCQSKQAEDIIMGQLEAASSAARLRSFETIKAIKLEHVPWSVENGLLTPTFKLKRPALSKHYEADIKQLYSQLELWGQASKSKHA